MDTETVVDARTQLELLRAELHRRGWHADHRGTSGRPYLHVRNPLDSGLNDSVGVEDGCFCWYWGPELGPTRLVQTVADRIMHVLRLVGP